MSILEITMSFHVDLTKPSKGFKSVAHTVLLAEAIKVNTSLTKLTLHSSDGQLSSEGLQAIVDGMKHNFTIIHLDLSSFVFDVCLV